MLRTNAVGTTGVTSFHFCGFSLCWPVLWLEQRVSKANLTVQSEVWMGPSQCECQVLLCASGFSFFPLDASSIPGDWVAVQLWEFPGAAQSVFFQVQAHCCPLAAYSILIALFPTWCDLRATGSSLGTQQHIK